MLTIKTRSTSALPEMINQRIETMFGQIVERYHAKKVWVRDTLHLTSRWLRKILSHTIAVLFCQQLGLSPLRFS